jgi:hypothetical protein
MNKGNAATIGIAYCEVCEHRSEGHERVMRLDWPLVEAPRGCCLVDGCGCPRFKLGRIEAPEDHSAHHRMEMRKLHATCQPCWDRKLAFMGSPKAGVHLNDRARQIRKDNGMEATR